MNESRWCTCGRGTPVYAQSYLTLSAYHCCGLSSHTLQPALASQVAILAIPGCNPNPYALGRCLIGSANLAAPLMLGLLGGL
jgi:hypothetical protein